MTQGQASEGHDSGGIGAGPLLLGLAGILVAIAGLFFAAKAKDDFMYLFGLIVFAASVLGEFWLINRVLNQSLGKAKTSAHH